jgi:hypothetical protein
MPTVLREYVVVKPPHLRMLGPPMMTPDKLEDAARRFCQSMSIRPDDTSKVKGRKLKNWQFAANQIHQHLALTMACTDLMNAAGEKTDAVDGAAALDN